MDRETHLAISKRSLKSKKNSESNTQQMIFSEFKGEKTYGI